MPKSSSLLLGFNQRKFPLASSISFLLAIFGSTATSNPVSSVNHDRETEIPQAIAKCDFLATEKPQEINTKNWSYYQSGLDLFRSFVDRQSVDYTDVSLSIHDTGLSAKGNPDAGAALEELSTDDLKDKDGHGTHVAGIAASKTFGVNPKLPVKVRKISAGMDYTEFEKTIVTSLEDAERDPTTKVISISMISYSEPKVKEVVERLLNRGVWIVYAAGNDGEVNPWTNELLRDLSAREELFAIGALSTIGLPAYFSNYGPNVDAFAPGEAITSLNFSYSPDNPRSKTSLILSGTSMAAPYAAAVLTTLRAIHPTLTPAEVRSLIKETSIVRGLGQNTIQELNPVVIAYYLVAYQKAKTDGQCKNLQQCYPRIRNHLSSWSDSVVTELKAPSSESCKEWNSYYKTLRTLHRYTRGTDPRVTSRLIDLGSLGGDVKAKAVYYSGAGQFEETLASFDQQHNTFGTRLAIDGAKEFLKSGIPSPKRDGEITSFEASLTNFEQIWKECRTNFYIRFDWHNSCAKTLFKSPLNLRRAVANRILSYSSGLSSIDVVKLLNIQLEKLDPSVNQNLISLAITGFAKRLPLPLEESWLDWLPQATLDERLRFQSLINTVNALPGISKVRSLAQILTTDTLTERELRELAPQVYHKKYPPLARLRLELDRRTVNFPKTASLTELLDLIVQNSDRLFELCKVAPGDTTSRPIECSDIQSALSDTSLTLQKLTKDASSAQEVLVYLTDAKKLTALGSIFSERPGMEDYGFSKLEFLSPIVSIAPKEIRRELIFSLANHWSSPDNERFERTISMTLWNNKKHDDVLQIIEELIRNPPQSETWIEVRKNYIKSRFEDTSAAEEELLKLYISLSHDERKSLPAPVKSLAKSPELQAILKQHISNWSSSSWYTFKTGVLNWMASPENIEMIMPELIPQIGDIFRFSGLGFGGVKPNGVKKVDQDSSVFTVQDVQELAWNVAEWISKHPEDTTTVMDQITSLLLDEKFYQGEDIVEGIANPMTNYEPILYRPERKSQILVVILIVAGPSKGAEYLNSHPEISRLLAKEIVDNNFSQPLYGNYGGYFGEDSITSGVKDALRQRLPTVSQVREKRDIPNWLSAYAGHDVENFSRMLEFANTVLDGHGGLAKVSNEKLRKVTNLTISLKHLISNKPESFTQVELRSLSKLIDRCDNESSRRLGGTLRQSKY